MKDMFKIKGRLCDASGVAAEGLFVALVDEDLLTRDDLIAVGRVGVDGGFQVAFMGSEIRQDAFEVEGYARYIEIDFLIKNYYPDGGDDLPRELL